MRCILNTVEITRTVIDALEEKKAEKILLLDIHEVASFTDYFVICSGTSDRMLDSLADGVMRKVREVHQLHGHAEGAPSGGWMIVDFGDIVVHLFSPDQREYYQLEELWSKGKILVHLQ
jgi:ribosome-associated protein